MKIIVACEFSGIVREAFKALGHDAYSCDILPSEITSSNHLKCDIRELDLSKYDLMVAHPPCTHLAVSGARHFYKKEKEQLEALDFVRYLLNAPVHRIALENPISIISSRIKKPTQIIHPCYFGHAVSKTTCLWLKNLPNLISTKLVHNVKESIHRMGPSPDRWRDRSRTFKGIADAMALQWGCLN